MAKRKKSKDPLHSDNHTKKVKSFVSKTVTDLIDLEPTTHETRQLAAALQAIAHELLVTIGDKEDE